MSFTYEEMKGPYAKKLDEFFGVKNSFIEVNPGKVLMTPQFKNIAQSILDAPVREDDVWLLSCPRTGSTWAQEMVWLIGNDFDYEGAKQIQQIRCPLIELSAVLVNDEYNNFMDEYGNSVEVVNNQKSPRYIKSHLPWELLPKQIGVVKPKMVYVARNPKDMCVSSYHYFQLVHNMSASFDDFCEIFLNDLMPSGAVWKHFLRFWEMRDEPNVLFIKYEEMKQDLPSIIRKVAKFLGKPITEEQTETLMNHLSFHNMKNNPSVNLQLIFEKTNGIDFCQEPEKSFIRKGQVGDWKNYMSPEMSKRFDDWIAENTKGTGLTF